MFLHAWQPILEFFGAASTNIAIIVEFNYSLSSTLFELCCKQELSKELSQTSITTTKFVVNFVDFTSPYACKYVHLSNICSCYYYIHKRTTFLNRVKLIFFSGKYQFLLHRYTKSLTLEQQLLDHLTINKRQMILLRYQVIKKNLMKSHLYLLKQLQDLYH